MTLRRWIWLGCCCLPILLSAQQAFFHTYGVEDGLLGGEGHDLYIDGVEGTIYVKTFDERLLLFDGSRFTPLTKPDSAVYESNERFSYNEAGLWWDSYHSEVTSFLDRSGEWHIYQKPKYYPVLQQVGESRLLKGLVDSSGQLWQYQEETRVLQPTGEQLFSNLPYADNEELERVEIFGDTLLYITTFLTDAGVTLNRNKYLLSPDRPDQFKLISDRYSYYRPIGTDYTVVRFRDSTDQYYIAHSDSLQPIRLPHLEEEQSPRDANLIQYVKFLSDTSLLYSRTITDELNQSSVQVWRLDKKGLSELLFTVPSRLVLHGNIFYSKGIYWLPSHEGLTKVTPAITEFSSTDADMVGALHAIAEDAEGNIWFGSYGEGFAWYDGEKVQRLEDERFSTAQIMPKPFVDEDYNIYFFEDRERRMIVNKQGKWQSKSTPNNHGDGRNAVGFYFTKLSDGRMGIGLNNLCIGIADSLEQAVDDWTIIGDEKGIRLGNVLHIAEDKKKRLWAGRHSTGVACYDPVLDTAVTWLKEKYPYPHFGSISGVVDEQDNLWLGCTNGLNLLPHASERSILELDLFMEAQHIELPMNDTSLIGICDIYQDYLVVGSQQAIYFLDLPYFYAHPEDRPRIFSFRFGEAINGSGSEQNTFYIDRKGQLWLGTQRGAMHIDLDQIPSDTTATMIEIERFVAGDEVIKLKHDGSYRLPQGKRNIELYYTAQHSPFLYNNLFFDCTLRHKSGDLIARDSFSQDRHFITGYLAPDEYVLAIEALKNNVVVDVYEFEFEVPKSIAEQAWFWLLVVLLILFGFSTPIIVYKRRIDKIKLEVEQKKRKQDALQVQSIAGALNPHFINNSLAWISSRYGQDVALTNMIGSLARNIKVIFEYTRSGKSYYTLEEEIKMIKNYLNIHKHRYGEERKIDVVLPPQELLKKWKEHPILMMLLQIHVENAVSHGIRNRKGAHQLWINMQEKPDYLVFTVEDDGIGREKAKQSPSRSTKQGTKMLRQMLDVFNQYNVSPITMIYEDEIFQNNMMESFGTRVIIQIPKYYTYEIGKTKYSRCRR
ncbi:MAG: histidine kinase [Bacteroidota bacterium]